MAYVMLPVANTRKFCEDIFVRRGFTQQESEDIVDVLLTADLYGIESHGVQRLIRYHNAMADGFVDPKAKPEIVFQTPISAVIDAPKSMGQVVSKMGMKMAIEMAKKNYIGAVCIRSSNHYGIAGYYASMAGKEDLLGICMTNSEAIAIPTYGKKAMLGTNPIAFCMPADPVDFWFDAATAVVTRGKLEVYNKKEQPLPQGWAADENGQDCSDAGRVIKNIVGKFGGGIFPLGGGNMQTGSHKGYGFGLVAEMFTSIFAGGTTSPHVRNIGMADTSFCFWAIDYGMFGDKKAIKDRMSTLLRELRESPKADGQDRIYTQGEKEVESEAEKLKNGIPVNDKTLDEMKRIGESVGVRYENYFPA